MIPVLYLNYYSAGPSLKPGELHRMEHKIGRTLLLRGLREVFHIILSEEEFEKKLRTEENGKPVLSEYPAVHFNISHCDGLVVCAFDSEPVGIDAEKPRRCPEAVFRKLFTEKERAFFDSVSVTEELKTEWFLRFWTLKESYIKQTGSGLLLPLNSFSFSFDLSPDPMAIACSDPQRYFLQYKLDSGHILSVCTAAPHETADLRFVE